MDKYIMTRRDFLNQMDLILKLGIDKDQSLKSFFAPNGIANLSHLMDVIDSYYIRIVAGHLRSLANDIENRRV